MSDDPPRREASGDGREVNVRLGVLVLTVVIGAIALRLVPLLWSPLPATLDGFDYAALAEQTLANDALVTPLDWDEIGFTLVLAVTSQIAGVQPLYFAQPISAVIGGLSVVGAVAIVTRWLGRRPRFDRRLLVVALAAVGVAVEGLYVRRTGAPDEELLGLVLVPLIVLVVDRLLRTHRVRWGVLALVFLAVLPPLHVLSSLVTLLCIVSLVALHLDSSLRTVVLGIGLGSAFGAYLWGYYRFAATSPTLNLVYVNRLLGAPGLFVAWIILLAIGVRWFAMTSRRTQQLLATGVMGSLFALLAVNMVTPVFPTTVATPPALLALVVPLAVPTLVATWFGVPQFDADEGAVVLSLFAGPAAIVAYALSANLTFGYYDTAIRTQTFLHFPVLVLAAIGGTLALDRVPRSNLATREGYSRVLRQGVIVLLIISLCLSAPLAFVTLDTMTVPRTTTESEFEAARFAAMHIPGHWATDDPLRRVATLYHGARGTPTQQATIAWLTGGRTPPCPLLLGERWVSKGAHLFPVAPQQIAPDVYRGLLIRRNMVYTTGGPSQYRLLLPSEAASATCPVGPR